jgi:hypothetical protein
MEYLNFINSSSISKNAFRNSVDQRIEHSDLKIESKQHYIQVKRSEVSNQYGIPRLLEPGEVDEAP